MTSSENPKLFDAIVISGGGIKGIVALGVLHYFYEKELYIPGNVVEYAGTSIGSVISLLLICGYTPMEVFQKVYTMENFFSLQDCNGFWNMFQKMGLMSVENMFNFIEELVINKLKFIPTLSELQKITGKRLCISASNVTLMREESFTPETHPDMSVIDAIMYSCNLPFIFQSLKYKEHYIVDGGLMNNFPWEYVTKDLNILGIIISMDGESPVDGDGFISYVCKTMLLTSTTLSAVKQQFAPENVRIIKTDWKGGLFIQFKISQDIKMEMFLSGYRSAERDEKKEVLKVEGWE